MKNAEEPRAAPANSGQFRRLAPPSWVRIQLAAQLRRIGPMAIEASPPREKQPQELEAPQLADMEPEP
jgi:hypothetical protein